MIAFTRIFIICNLILGRLILPSFHLFLDVGPAPPSMDFLFEYEISPVNIIQGELYICSDKTCSESELVIGTNLYIKERFDCNDTDKCWAWSGNLNRYRFYKLIVQFSDKTRESQPFSKFAYGAQYKVIVNQDDLSIREIYSGIGSYFDPLQSLCFLPALIFTLICEISIAALYGRLAKLKISYVWLANIISFPIVWFIFPFINWNYIYVLVLAEVFAIFIEAGILYILSQKPLLPIKHALLVSLVINLSSIGLAMGVLFLIQLIEVG